MDQSKARPVSLPDTDTSAEFAAFAASRSIAIQRLVSLRLESCAKQCDRGDGQFRLPLRGRERNVAAA